MRTIKELRQTLIEAVVNLKNDRIDPIHANSIAKLCDAIIETTKAELAYSRMKGEVPNIEFLESSVASQLEQIEEEDHIPMEDDISGIHENDPIISIKKPLLMRKRYESNY